jgi:hypothetical protein
VIAPPLPAAEPRHTADARTAHDRPATRQPARQLVSTSCQVHPDEVFTDFCTACLREHL